MHLDHVVERDGVLSLPVARVRCLTSTAGVPRLPGRFANRSSSLFGRPLVVSGVLVVSLPAGEYVTIPRRFQAAEKCDVAFAERRRLRTGTVRFMAGLAPDENPREMAQEHSQEWLCRWGCRPNVGAEAPTSKSVYETYPAAFVAPIMGKSWSRVNGEKAARSSLDGCAL